MTNSICFLNFALTLHILLQLRQQHSLGTAEIVSPVHMLHSVWSLLASDPAGHGLHVNHSLFVVPDIWPAGTILKY